ncbi:MFS transporter [Paralcaligenes ginsengisoli]
MRKSAVSLSQLTPLFLIILIDSTGYTIVIPTLAALLLDEPPLLMGGDNLAIRYMVYGFAIGIYELIMLYMAPVLGELSDRLGRRRILILCLIGIAASFLLIAGAIAFNLIWLLILGRIIGGATAGSQAVAQAAAVDNAPPQKRPLALNICLLVSSIGFILGPLIGGSLSHDSLVQASDFILPFLLTAALAMAVLALFCYMFKEPPVSRAPANKIDLFMGVHGFRRAWGTPAIQRLAIIFGLMQFAWGTYFLFLPSLLITRFNEDTGTVSLLMSALGIGFCLAYGVVLPFLQRHVSARRLSLCGLGGTAALIAVSIATHSMLVQMIIAVPIAVLVSVAYGAIIVLFTHTVDEQQQGWILGITISINAAVWGLASIASGALSGISPIAPFLFAFAAMAASAIAMSLPASRLAQTKP